MGQRLIINIVKDGETLAGAYYHWKAYTKTALSMCEHILRTMQDLPQGKMNDKLYAVRLLESTGAGITPDETDSLPESLQGESFVPCVSRNEGLIDVTGQEAAAFQELGEGFIWIDLNTATAKFTVFYTMHGVEEHFQEEDIADALNCDRWDMDKLSLDDVVAFKEALTESNAYLISYKEEVLQVIRKATEA